MPVLLEFPNFLEEEQVRNLDVTTIGNSVFLSKVHVHVNPHLVMDGRKCLGASRPAGVHVVSGVVVASSSIINDLS